MNSAVQQQMKYLLDRTKPFEQTKANLVDQLTYAIKNNTDNSKVALQLWNQLKEDHYFWHNAEKVLTLCQLHQTKVYMLVLLENRIKEKWMTLSINQRDRLKYYIINLILKYAAVQNLQPPLQTVLSKCNTILVQIVKYEWNTTWQSFIQDLCNVSGKNINVCQNNLSILKMLSEEIFDHSKHQLTQHQIKDLKQKMNQDFTIIFQLCNYILQNAHQAKNSLVKACLETLNAFLSWIPMQFIINTDMIDKLVLMLQVDYLCNNALNCLVQIASLPIDPQKEQQKNKYVFMLQRVTEELDKLIPLTNQSEKVEQLVKSARKKNRIIFEVFSKGIVNFYSEYFKNQYSWLQNAVKDNQEAVKICRYGFRYIIMMMKIEQEQVFKIAMEFFHTYISNYIQQMLQLSYQQLTYRLTFSKFESIYRQIFGEVIKILCLKMAKPEQVIIVIDQYGQPVRQQLQNTENIQLYKMEREVGRFLVKYNWSKMKKIIFQQIQKQKDNKYFSVNKLNSVCWLVGSLQGSIHKYSEQSDFFISTVLTLLNLCQNKQGKQNKVFIASCILHVVGQYTTILRFNWIFLKVFTNKLFEFMAQKHPGIKEMACNTFLKISKSCSDHFTIRQKDQFEPFINYIIRDVHQHTRKLDKSLKLIFYQSLGHLIYTAEPEKMSDFFTDSIGIYLSEFESITHEAMYNNRSILKDETTTKTLMFFFKVNQMLASGTGRHYSLLLNLIYQQINKLYLYYCFEINDMISTHGKHVLNFNIVKTMRMMKRQIIRIYTKMLEACTFLPQFQAEKILKTFILPLEPLLVEFQQCAPETKDHQFVALFNLVLQKLDFVIDSQFLNKLLELIFRPTLQLILKDFSCYPDMRSNFFFFLKAIVKYNFNYLISFPEDLFTLILDCILWSTSHQLSTYADLGLNLLQDILCNIKKVQNMTDQFYARYLITVLCQILKVMTDGFHKSGVSDQIKILFILINVTTQNTVVSPIAADKPNQQSNYQYLYNYIVNKLSLAFPNVGDKLTQEKVRNWFTSTDQKLFEAEVQDYLILINRYSKN